MQSLRDPVRQIIMQWRQSATGTMSAVNLTCCSEVPKELSLPIQLRARIENEFSCSVLTIVAVVVVSNEQ